MEHSARKRRWAAVIVLASVMTMAGSAWVWSAATAAPAAPATVHTVSAGNPRLGPPGG